MGKKQLKIAISDDFYEQLSKEAKKQKLPVSSYARSLMAEQMQAGQEMGQSRRKSMETPSGNKKDKDNDLVLLSDVLDKDEKDADDKNAAKSTAIKSKGEPININISIS